MLLRNYPSDVFYWEPSSNYVKHGYLPDDTVSLNVHQKPKNHYLFIAQVKASVIKDSKMVGYYNKTEFPPDFNSTLVGVGQAECDTKDIPAQDHQMFFKTCKVYMPLI